MQCSFDTILSRSWIELFGWRPRLLIGRSSIACCPSAVARIRRAIYTLRPSYPRSGPADEWNRPRLNQTRYETGGRDGTVTGTSIGDDGAMSGVRGWVGMDSASHSTSP